VDALDERAHVSQTPWPQLTTSCTVKVISIELIQEVERFKKGTKVGKNDAFDARFSRLRPEATSFKTPPNQSQSTPSRPAR
jgi:hypothetical protein